MKEVVYNMLIVCNRIILKFGEENSEQFEIK